MSPCADSAINDKYIIKRFDVYLGSGILDGRRKALPSFYIPPSLNTTTWARECGAVEARSCIVESTVTTIQTLSVPCAAALLRCLVLRSFVQAVKRVALRVSTLGTCTTCL